MAKKKPSKKTENEENQFEEQHLQKMVLEFVKTSGMGFNSLAKKAGVRSESLWKFSKGMGDLRLKSASKVLDALDVCIADVHFLHGLGEIQEALTRAVSNSTHTIKSIGEKTQDKKFLNAILSAVEERQIKYSRIVTPKISHEMHLHINKLPDPSVVKCNQKVMPITLCLIDDKELFFSIPSMHIENARGIHVNSHAVGKRMSEYFDEMYSDCKEFNPEEICERNHKATEADSLSETDRIMSEYFDELYSDCKEFNPEEETDRIKWLENELETVDMIAFSNFTICLLKKIETSENLHNNEEFLSNLQWKARPIFELFASLGNTTQSQSQMSEFSFIVMANFLQLCYPSINFSTKGSFGKYLQRIPTTNDVERFIKIFYDVTAEDSATERQIYWLFIKGYRLEEISEMVNVSLRSVKKYYFQLYSNLRQQYVNQKIIQPEEFDIQIILDKFFIRNSWIFDEIMDKKR